MLWPGVCHCTTCQKFSGGAGGAWFGARRAAAEISGGFLFYEYTADSGNKITRANCEKCRAPVYNRNSMMSDIVIFAAATLDNPAAFAPAFRIYTASVAPWDLSGRACPAGMTEFAKMPPFDGAAAARGGAAR